jgi:hypothetical protein
MYSSHLNFIFSSVCYIFYMLLVTSKYGTTVATVFTNIIINTRGYELYKYFTIVQFFEDFIEEKGFINLFVSPL